MLSLPELGHTGMFLVTLLAIGIAIGLPALAQFAAPLEETFGNPQVAGEKNDESSPVEKDTG